MTAPQAKVYALDESDEPQVSLSRAEQLSFAIKVMDHPMWKDHSDVDENGVTRNYRCIGFNGDTANGNYQMTRCMLDDDDQVVSYSVSPVSVSR